jgi:hypothetical protein
MHICRYPGKETRRREEVEVTRLWPSSWPNLSHLLTSLDKRITCLQINQGADGHKAIIRFRNGYGLEIFKYLDGDSLKWWLSDLPEKELRSTNLLLKRQFPASSWVTPKEIFLRPAPRFLD